MRLYHFTSARHLPQILRDESLRPSESNVGSPSPDMPPFGMGVGPDVVWLLDSPDLDHNHGLFADKTGKDAVRFEVEVPALRWTDWAWTAQMHPTWRDIMIDSAGGTDAAQHWYVFPAEIPMSRWITVTDLRQGLQVYPAVAAVV